MIIVNRPSDELIQVQCYKCNAIFGVHPMQSSNSPFITDCELHKCQHERNEQSPPIATQSNGGYITEWQYKCKKCGEFYK